MISTLLRWLGLDSAIKWMKPSFEGDDNKSSARRLTTFLIVTLYVIGHVQFFRKINDPYWLIRLILIDAIFICVLFSIINLQQLLTIFIKAKNGITDALDEPEKDKSTKDTSNPDDQTGVV